MPVAGFICEQNKYGAPGLRELKAGDEDVRKEVITKCEVLWRKQTGYEIRNEVKEDLPEE